MSFDPSRRRFLGSAVALTVVPQLLQASSEPRALSLFHCHTGERLSVEYFERGRYLPDALQAIRHLLRDFRTGEEHRIDEGLLDLLYSLRQQTATAKPFEIISGYRSPKTNATLRQQSEGVAAGSLHMAGQAVDIRLADIALPQLRQQALELGRGGVGYYPASNFVHVDTGRVRHW